MSDVPIQTPFAIGVFTRPPDPGATKTRLIPTLGADGAALLHLLMLERTLKSAAQTGAGVSLWVTENAQHPRFATFARRFSCAVHVQTGEDLGSRMRNALVQMLIEHKRALVIGSDCLVHTPQSLILAAEQLSQSDLVFTPAEDGGYVLVGARQDCPQAFEGIDWGTAQVMAQTRQRLSSVRASWAEQPVLWDVDLPADVLRARREGLI